MGKKVFSTEELEKYPAATIIDMLQHHNYSLLKSLGADKLRREMVPVGKICNSAINYIFDTTGPKNDEVAHTKNARKKLVKLLSKIAPGAYNDIPHENQNGLVVGFNHPSLGEIPRILAMKIDKMGDKPMYFPVNLPWYEALAPNYDKIKKLGIIITPTITPSTWAKLKLDEGSDLYRIANQIKHDFRNVYTDLSRQAMRDGGVIFVAPAATRQATVFKSKSAFDGEDSIIPTMSMLAVKLYSEPDIKCDFLPLAVLPPKNFKKGLNLGKRYTLIPGRIMHADEIRRKYFKASSPKRLDGFDLEFHKRIAEKLPEEFWF